MRNSFFEPKESLSDGSLSKSLLSEVSTQSSAPPSKPRYFGIDLLRLLSCYMVMQVHSGEYYYIDDNFTVRKGTGPFWVGIYNTILYSCVPLFVMISGYLLLPVKTDIPAFLKTRFTRVLFPFFFWCIIYSFYFFILKRITFSECLINIPKIFVNYGVEIGHLWYIYMLIGVYLFAPIISPWIKQASVSQFLYFISFWLVSCCFNYIHLLFPQIWGECSWNNTPMLQCFTGHFGYAVLGSFIKLHLDTNKKDDFYWLGCIFLVVGYVVTTVIFEVQYYRNVKSSFDLEIGLNFHTINVGMMAFGFFLLFRKIQCKNKYVVKIVNDVAVKSYGMYLTHIIILDQFHNLFDQENKRPCIFIPVVAICTFVVTFLLIKLISFIPYSKFIIG